jgi:signal peptidase I
MIAGLTVLVAFVALDAGAEGRSFRNVSPAMEPALLAGERFTMRNITSRNLSQLEHGSLIAYAYPPDPTKQFVKRIVGMPGDTIGMIHGIVSINGRPLAEPYAWHGDSLADPVWPELGWQRRYVIGALAVDTAHYHPSRDNWGPLALPTGHYFVLGDNRDNSLDSRFSEFLSASDFTGQPRRVYFSQDPTTGRIRWSRFGRRLR